HFLARRSRGDSAPLTVSDTAMALLYDYDWPGNVRELEHLIERVAILADDGAIDVQHLPSAVTTFTARKMTRERAHVGDGLNLKRTVNEFEMDLIQEALQRTRGNRQAAARLLGLKRTTLVAKIRRRPMPCEPLLRQQLAV